MPPSNQDLLTRVSVLELQFGQTKDHLDDYVQKAEYNVQLAAIQASVSRIEADVKDIKAKLEQLQIRAVWAVVSAVGAIGTLVLGGYITHILH